ncbi:hypothetical protein DLE01_06910, partial [Streptomyces sp. FT05W]
LDEATEILELKKHGKHTKPVVLLNTAGFYDGLRQQFQRMEVYELTEHGRGLLPVLTALARWGAPALDERRPTDAVRAHWFALPLLRALDGLTHSGVVEVRLPEGEFHLRIGAEAPGEVYGYGPADRPDACLVLDADAVLAVGRGGSTLVDAVEGGRAEVLGEGPLADELRGGQCPRA